jgi:hypothetical protein|tara:strand:+ start:615 stop:905 length:291 start_codon:yes stop_codon:yes gene_type:complete
MLTLKNLIIACVLLIPFACVGDVLIQEPVEVPVILEMQDEDCINCNRQPVREILQRKTVRRVVMERPAVETFVQVTRERRARRKPVRSLVRRLFGR